MIEQSEHAPAQVVVEASTCECGQPLEDWHHEHCPRCGAGLRRQVPDMRPAAH